MCPVPYSWPVLRSKAKYQNPLIALAVFLRCSETFARYLLNLPPEHYFTWCYSFSVIMFGAVMASSHRAPIVQQRVASESLRWHNLSFILLFQQIFILFSAFIALCSSIILPISWHTSNKKKTLFITASCITASWSCVG